MGIISTFKALGAINKATKFVKNHEDTVNRVKDLITKVQNAIEFLKTHRDTIQSYIDKAIVIKEKLKGIVNK